MANKLVTAGLSVVALALAPTLVYSQSAPGAEARCSAAFERCSNNANNAGEGERCSAGYQRCINAASQAGEAYRKSSKDQTARDAYQRSMGNR